MPRVRSNGGILGPKQSTSQSVAGGVWYALDATILSSNNSWPLTVIPDPYFNLNSLLIHADGSNGANNSVFTDSSVNAYTVTRNGTPTQGTFSPFSQTGWSNYFDGTGDFLTLSPGASFAFGTGDFTVELWYYPTSGVTSEYLIENRTSGQTTGVWTFTYNWTGSNSGTLYWSNNGSTSLGQASGSTNTNSWNHIVYVRSGTTGSMYINGTRVATQTDSTNYSNNPVETRIGARYSVTAGDQYVKGYISNVRVVKGTAVYDPTQTTLTVPVAPLSAISNTVLLTCQANRLVDNSTNAYAITKNGDVAVQPYSPLAPTTAYTTSGVGGSAYFNGSSDYLSAPLTFSSFVNSSTWTIEGWYKFDDFSATRGMCCCSDLIEFYTTASTMTFAYRNTPASPKWSTISASVSLKADTWYHVAAVLNSGTITLYVNGVSAGTATSVGNGSWGGTGSNNVIFIGANDTYTFGSIDYYMKGYISSFRFTNTAVYATLFTPPTSPTTAISGTLILLNYTNAGIYDQTAKNVMTTYGTAAVSTTQSKFGSSSLLISVGDSNNIQIPHNKWFDLSSGNFTIEFWIYLNTNATYNFVISKGTSGAREWGINVGPSNTIRFYWSTNGSSTGDSTISSSSGTTPLTTWMHIAVVRSGSTITIYKDGTSVGSGSFTSMYSGTSTVVIGRFMDFTGIGHYLDGYLDDLRISKYARYTTNFTPPTIALVDQ
jgi:hypothetical protein